MAILFYFLRKQQDGAKASQAEGERQHENSSKDSHERLLYTVRAVAKQGACMSGPPSAAKRTDGPLHGKARSAATGARGVGIAERKPTVIQPILPVHFHAGQIKFVRLFDHKMHPVGFVLVVFSGTFIETQHVRESRTAPAFYTDA